MGSNPSPVRRAAFFKILLGDYTEKLRIPPAFINNFHGKSIDEAILECRNGRLWPVKVEEGLGKLFFQNGWQGFVKDNLLEVGDFLVFRYDGNSTFEVEIFGKNGCEMVRDLPNKKELQNEKHNSTLDVEIFDKNGCEMVLDLPHKKEQQNDQQNEKENVVNATTVCNCKYTTEFQIDESVVHAKKRGGKIKSKFALGIKATMVCKAVSCPLKLKHPHFAAKWRTCKPYTVLIPKAFVREFGLREEKSRFLCDPSGKLWPVKITHSCNRSDIGAGWHDFRMGNNMGEGDRCILEFIQDSVIQVHIIRCKE